MTRTSRRSIAAGALTLALTACGGNGPTPAVSTGAVRGFGSIQVNGVEWKVKGATLTLRDGVTQLLSSENAIRTLVPQGAVVTVKGTSDGATGTATKIEFKSTIEGPLVFPGTVVPSPGGFTVAGLNVSVDDATTFFDSAGNVIAYDASLQGQRVEVSGMPESSTSLHATMVRVKGAGQAEFEAKGFVVALSGSTFGISLASGGAPYLNVNAAGVTLPQLLSNGAIAEVKGTTFTAGSPGTLAATAVGLEDRLLGDEKSGAEVEGIITGLSGTSFNLDGQAVTVGATTRYVGAADPATPTADLADGVRVEVEGHLQAGTLVAEQVKFKDAVRIQAPAAAVLGGGLTFTVLTLQVITDPVLTRVDGAVVDGATVEVRGYPRRDGAIFAQRVTVRSGGNDRPFVQGVATAKAASSLTILGITVSTDASTQFRDTADKALSSSAFLGAVTAGQTLVKARWEVGTTDINATAAREVELEGEND